jgi:predicted secreted protein
MKKRVLAFIATTIVSAVMAYLWKSLQDKITNAINNMFEEVEV